MTPEHWSMAKRLFAQAMARQGSDRHDFLHSLTCDDDVRTLVAKLVDAHSRVPASFLAEPDVLTPGQTLRGRFQIVRAVGAGGMGQVYEAEDLQLKERIALKTLHSRFESTDSLERVKRELMAARRVSHPGVCRVHDMDVERVDGRVIVFLTMEFLEGETLSDWLERAGPMSPAQAIPILRQCGAALDAAHREGVVHGDFKPSNIFLCRSPSGDQRTVVTDFGLARIVDSADTTSEVVWGTPAFMAPELLAGQRPTPASDIYAFGVVIREMVGLDREAHSRSRIGERWKRVVERCVLRDPDHRPPSASEATRRLDRALPGRRMAAAITAALLLVLAGLVATIDARARLAVLPFEAIPQSAELDALTRGLVQVLGSELASLEAVRSIFLVIAPTELAEHGVATASEAQRTTGATHVLSGSLDRRGDRFIVTVNRIDPRTLAQRSVSRTLFVHEAPALQRALLQAALELLDVDLQPGALAKALTDEGASPAYEFYVQGLGYLERGPESAGTALAVFREALKRDAAFPPALAGAAQANLHLYGTTKIDAHRQEAEAQLAAVQTLAPGSLFLYMARGLHAVVTGQLEQAASAYEAALKLDPFNGDIYRRLANVYRRRGEDLRAQRTLGQAILMRPDYWAGFLDLGVLHSQLGQNADAARNFKRVTELAPDNVRGHVSLGGAYIAMRRYAEAEEELRIALRLNPIASAYSNLGAVLLRQQRFDDAVLVLRDGSQAHPHDVVIWLNLGRALANSKGPETAVESYSRAAALAEEQLAVNPRNAELRSRHALALAQLDRPAEALEKISAARVLAPKNVVVLLNAVLVYERSDRRDLAIEVCQDHGTADFVAQLETFPELRGLLRTARCRSTRPGSNAR